MRLGIDIGSVSLKLALVDEEGGVGFAHYARTGGRPVAALLAALQRLREETGLERVDGVAATGSGKALVTRLEDIASSNEILAHARAVSRLHPEVRTVIEIGGQDAKLILLDGHGDLLDHAFNDLCAAGTGAFLDQQAARLGVSIERFSAMAARARKAVPVASRCAVFAKSDMIHHQQEGIPPDQVARGLCLALARNYLANMLRGRRPGLPVAFCGGVARNEGVRRAFSELIEIDDAGWILPEHHHVMGAIGAALVARTRPVELGALARLAEAPASRSPRLAPLPRKSHRMEQPNDRQALSPEAGDGGLVYLGLDLGSVSAKGVLADRQGRMLASHYTATEGRPLDALGTVLASLAGQVSGDVVVAGCGVTGSGRMVAQTALGADVVHDEITAQLTASRALDPEVDTVFEIGGQDSKVMLVRDGQLVDFALNRICAAGTGSFLAEQADRLGIRVEEEFGERALRSEAPVDLGSRCTVFMDSDLIHHQQMGCSTDDLLAGLAFSVAQNFLEHVVEGREIGKRIWFQGGVAANPAVAAAFEALLGREIQVHPHHAVTGALGAALLARDDIEAHPRSSTFVGFDAYRPDADTRTFTCKHCDNHCEVVQVKVPGAPPLSFGGGCDRYERSDRKEEVRHRTRFYRAAQQELERCFEEQPEGIEREVGLPRALWTLTLAPFWVGFFNSLGVRATPSRPSTRALYRRGLKGVVSEHCYGVKLSMGHVYDLIEQGVDTIFLPSYAGLPSTADEKQAGQKSTCCPYVQSLPDIARAGFAGIRLLAPRLDLSRGPTERDCEIMWREVGKVFGADLQRTARALAAGWTAWARYRGRLRALGRQALAECSDERIIVLAGHPYQLQDPLLNFAIPARAAACGATTLPAFILPLGDVRLDESWSRVYWRANRDLLRLTRWLADRPAVLPVLTTAFGCGPDAFATRYVQELRKGKPLLVLELDEHTAEAGLLTRLQAYLANARPAAHEPAAGRYTPVPYRKKKLRGRTAYIPAIGDQVVALKAAFLLEGQEAHILPPTSIESLKQGRAWSSGRECNPFAFILGDLLGLVGRTGFDPERSRFFLPSTTGPCLLSQFGSGFELALHQLGIENMRIDDPCSADLWNGFCFKNLVRMWEGFVAVEVLTQMLGRARPFETRPGAAERVHAENMGDLERALLAGDVAGSLQRSRERLMAVTGPEDPDRPEIALVGDVFTRLNPAANANLHHRIEALGCRVRVPPLLTDTAWHDAGEAVVLALRQGQATETVRAALLCGLQAFLGRRLQWSRGFGAGAGLDYISWSYWAAGSKLKGRLTHDVDSAMAMNVVLALDAVENGADAVVNAICHNCMVGMVSDTLFKRMNEEPGMPPVVTLAFDGLQETNTNTRLEAICERAHLRRKGVRTA